MKAIKSLIYSLIAVIAIILCGCHAIPEYKATPTDNFDALWDFVDTHYCYFDEKDVDWNEVRERYRPRASVCTSSRALFMVCAEMLDELKDGHVNLSSWFETSYYRKWWSDYPQNYDARLVEQYYFNFNYHSIGSAWYDILPGTNIGYLRLPTFTSSLGNGNLNAILSYFRTCRGIIIDIRDNGGGMLTAVEDIVRRFIPRSITAYYLVNKSGPGHADFAEPYAVTFNTPIEGCISWGKPVVVLTNRSTFSAANAFAAIMASLPNVTIVGDTTGGGGGMPISGELPYGWGIRVSSCRILDGNGNDIERGISPGPQWHVDLDPEQALLGRDTMLEAAIEAIGM